MKLILKTVICLCLMAVSADARMSVVGIGGSGSTIVYNNTITGLRISAVDGTAFIDNCAAIVSYADGNYQVRITDSSGYTLIGTLKAAGSSLSYDSELVSNGNMETGDPPTGWPAFGTAVVDSAADERTGGAGSASISLIRGTSYASASQTISMSEKALYYVNFWGKIITAGGRFGTRIVASPYTWYTNNTWTNCTEYVTASTYGKIELLSYSASTAEVRIDDTSVKKVLTPSSSGCTIVSTRQGTTYNFTTVNASFIYNETSYKVEVIQ